MAKELCISIKHNGSRQPMEFNHISKEESSYIVCIIYLVAWYEMRLLTKLIYNHKDRTKSPLGLG